MKGADGMSINLNNVSKSFGSNRVLEDFNLTVEDNSRLCIMGESGSGKTTLLNIIAGILKPDTGTVKGVDKRRIGFVFQDDRLVEELTVYRNIKLVCNKSVTKSVVSKALEAVGLSAELTDAKVSTLSGGMKRRIAILRALLCDSEIILMDEPTKGLDDENKQIVVDYIIYKTENRILVCVTHDREEAEKISDKVLVI